jgi:hypothetical protein
MNVELISLQVAFFLDYSELVSCVANHIVSYVWQVVLCQYLTLSLLHLFLVAIHVPSV